MRPEDSLGFRPAPSLRGGTEAIQGSARSGPVAPLDRIATALKDGVGYAPRRSAEDPVILSANTGR